MIMAGTAAAVSAEPPSRSRLFVRGQKCLCNREENARDEALSIDSRPQRLALEIRTRGKTDRLQLPATKIQQ